MTMSTTQITEQDVEFLPARHTLQTIPGDTTYGLNLVHPADIGPAGGVPTLGSGDSPVPPVTAPPLGELSPGAPLPEALSPGGIVTGGTHACGFLARDAHTWVGQ